MHIPRFGEQNKVVANERVAATDRRGGPPVHGLLAAHLSR
jgi:hypothetical protein